MTEIHKACSTCGKLIDFEESLPAEKIVEIRLIAESIVSCIDGGRHDNAKILAESIIAECSIV